MKRVFLGPVEVAGYYAGLEAGLVELGYRVLRVDLEADKRRYRIGKQPMAARLILAVRRYEATIASGITRRCLGPIQSLLRWVLLMHIAFTCETFVYGFAATVTWYPRLELRLLRRLRKRIVFVYHGSDGRPPFLDGQIMASARRLSTAKCA